MARFAQILRFGAVGLINTAVDVGIFVALRQAGVPLIIANIISTSVALGVSYLLNFRFTFKSNHSQQRLVWFLAVTCSGLWLLHPIVIKTMTALDGPIPILRLIQEVTGSRGLAYDAVPKLAATAVTLVWNYAWYSLKVFRKKSETSAAETNTPT